MEFGVVSYDSNKVKVQDFLGNMEELEKLLAENWVTMAGGSLGDATVSISYTLFFAISILFRSTRP